MNLETDDLADQPQLELMPTAEIANDSGNANLSEETLGTTTSEIPEANQTPIEETLNSALAATPAVEVQFLQTTYWSFLQKLRI